jgi:hypothetical protein
MQEPPGEDFLARAQENRSIAGLGKATTAYGFIPTSAETFLQNNIPADDIAYYCANRSGKPNAINATTSATAQAR